MRIEFEEYFNQLCLLFGSEALTVLLLKTVSVLYPALASIGISFWAPLMVVVQNEQQAHMLLTVLQGYGLPTVTTLAEKPKGIRKILEDIPYGLAIFRYASGRYLAENLEQLAQKAAEMDVSIPLKPLIIIIAVGGLPPVRCMDKLAGTIYLRGENYVDCRYVELLEIERPFILHWLEIGWQKSVLQTGEPLDVFRIAVDFLVDFFRSSRCGETEVEGLKEALNERLHTIETVWDTSGDPDEYAQAFCNALFGAIDWLPKPILDRRKVEGVAVEELHLRVYFDRSCYYLPQPIFEKMCESLVGDAGIEQLKGLLVDAELLISEKGANGRNYFAPKVEIVTAMGYRERVRMIRLARDKVDRPGELSFKELIETRGWLE